MSSILTPGTTSQWTPLNHSADARIHTVPSLLLSKLQTATLGLQFCEKLAELIFVTAGWLANWQTHRVAPPQDVYNDILRESGSEFCCKSRTNFARPDYNKIFMKADKLKQFVKRKKLSSQVLIAIGAGIFVYMLIATVEAIWQNYQINLEITKLRTEIVQLEQEGEELEHLIAYRGTESFKEREARRKLGYRKPYEKVIAIPQPKFNNTEPGQTKSTEEDQEDVTQSNPQKWWDYIFG